MRFGQQPAARVIREYDGSANRVLPALHHGRLDYRAQRPSLQAHALRRFAGHYEHLVRKRLDAHMNIRNLFQTHAALDHAVHSFPIGCRPRNPPRLGRLGAVNHHAAAVVERCAVVGFDGDAFGCAALTNDCDGGVGGYIAEKLMLAEVDNLVDAVRFHKLASQQRTRIGSNPTRRRDKSERPVLAKQVKPQLKERYVQVGGAAN